MTKFQRGMEFPNEGFVQRSIEVYFKERGYIMVPEGYADLVCIHESTSEKWVVEAKGKTSAIGLDFRTGLGQIIQKMDSVDTKYAIAVPNIMQFIQQCKQISSWVRKSLNLHILLINDQGNVQVVGAQDTFPK